MTRPDYDIKWREDEASYENKDQLEAKLLSGSKKFIAEVNALRKRTTK